MRYRSDSIAKSRDMGPLSPHCLRVVFPLRGARAATGAEIPEKWEKSQNSPLRSDPRKWGKMTEKVHKKCIFGVIVPFFGALFPIFGGRTGEGNFVIFPRISGISAPVGDLDRGGPKVERG